MGIELKGLNRLLTKLDNVSKVSTAKILEEVAESTADAIKDSAKQFSDTAYQYAGTVEVRKYGLSSFIDVGFSSDNTPFELWKPLWFQHWGFNDYGLNFTGQFYISNNKNWFEEAINKHEKQAIKAIKTKTLGEIRKAFK